MSVPCNNPCQLIICSVPVDLEQFVLPPPPPDLIYNQQVTVELFCSGGRAPYYSGSSLPSWITLDIANNRIIGQWGIYSGTDQSAANAIAQAALVLAVQQLGIACVWYSQLASLVCGDGSTVIIPTNTYHSTISQADADSQASAAAAAGCAIGCTGTDVRNYGIQNYVDGMVLNAQGNNPVAGDAVWDGTFKYKTTANSSCYWGTSPTGTYLLINGKRGAARIFYHNTAPLEWILDINAQIGQGTLWEGAKTSGNSPAGIYTRLNGLDAGPATITIVLISGTATIVASTQY